MRYIKTDTEFTILQPIFGSADGDNVTISIQRESDNKYWDFDESEFVVAESSGTMSWEGNYFWSESFTPPEDDSYMVKIEDTDLPYLSRGEYDDDLDCILAYEYDATTICRVLVSVAGGYIDYGWSPQTKVNICNITLRMLGAKRITSLEDETDPARVLNDVYDRILDEVLAAYPWNFAIHRASLSQLSETPTYGYDYAYALPTSCLRVISVQDQEYTDWEQEDNKLLTNEDSINVRYISREVDPTKYSSYFIQAFTARLAAEIAFPLTGDAGLANNKFEEYQLKLSQAKSTNSQEGTPRKMERSSWLEAR